MITKKQREERGGYVGSSDIPLIMGVSPWGNIYDLWLEKTGKLDKKDEMNDAMADGIMLEPFVVRWASKRLGAIEKRSSMLEFKHSELPIVSHPDGIVKASGEPVEAKTSGLRGRLMDGWGESGTDQIPDLYVLQVTTHIMCMKAQRCHVPAFLGGRGVQMYQVERSETLIEMISEKVAAFWKLVQSDIPPQGWATLDIARMIRRTEGKRLQLEAGIVQKWRDLDAQAKAAQDKADEAKAAVLTMMGDAEIGETELGIVKVTKSKTERIDGKALWDKFPYVAKQVSKESETVRINWKENKK